jgi:hypothetical protein
LLDSDDDCNDDDTATPVNDDNIQRVKPTTSPLNVPPPKTPAKYQSLRRDYHQMPVELDFLPKTNFTNTRIPRKTDVCFHLFCTQFSVQNPPKPNFDVDSVLNDLELPKTLTDKEKQKLIGDKTKPVAKVFFYFSLFSNCFTVKK